MFGISKMKDDIEKLEFKIEHLEKAIIKTHKKASEAYDKSEGFSPEKTEEMDRHLSFMRDYTAAVLQLLLRHFPQYFKKPDETAEEEKKDEAL